MHHLLAGSLLLMSPAAPGPYPASRVDPVEDDYHGTKVADPYRWLEDATTPEVQTWIAEQGNYTRTYLDALPGRDALKAQYEALWEYPITYSVSISGERLFWSYRGPGQDQPLIYTGPMGSGPKDGIVFLDLNQLNAEGTTALDWMTASPDGELVAYGLSESGSELSTLHVKNAITGELLPDRIPRTRASSIAWLPNKSGFYYSRLPEPGTVAKGDESFYRRVFFHQLGDDPTSDPLIFADESNKETWISAGSSTDDSTLFISTSLDWSKNDLYMRPLKAPLTDPWTILAVGLDGQTSADVVDDTLIIMTNVGHPRFHILKANLATPDERTEIIPESDAVIEGMWIVGKQLAVQTLENAYNKLRIYDLDGKLEREIEFPTLGSVSEISAHDTEPILLCNFTSYTYATAVLKIHTDTGEVEVVSQLAIPLDWDRYQVRQEWATSKDGTKVPMFIVSLAGLPMDGTNPTILYGYGGFNNSLTPGFSRGALPWIEAGGIYVYTNLRGGGEFGKDWHDAGRLEKKQNVYDDFYACADHLFERGYTSPAKMAISGGSNGGLLVGAALTQRPDLCRAAICAVPLLDMLRYQHFLLGRLWVPEYGDADVASQFGFIYDYSPYHHVVDGTKYPAVLFMSGDQDSRVDPLHARKMAARMQAATGGEHPILLRVEFNAGHGQGTPLSKTIDELTDQYTFLAHEFGMANFPAPSPLSP